MSKVVVLQTGNTELKAWRGMLKRGVCVSDCVTVTAYCEVAESLVETHGAQLLIVNSIYGSRELTTDFVEKMKRKNPALVAGSFSACPLYGDPFDFGIQIDRLDDDAFLAVLVKIEQFLRSRASALI